MPIFHKFVDHVGSLRLKNMFCENVAWCLKLNTQNIMYGLITIDMKPDKLYKFKFSTTWPQGHRRTGVCCLGQQLGKVTDIEHKQVVGRVMANLKHRLNKDFSWQNVTPPFKLISELQAESWNRDGYFLLENVLDHRDIDNVEAAIDPMEAETNAYLRTLEDKRKYIARADEITFALHPVTKSEVARKFAMHPVFAGLCLDLLGDTSRLYWDQAVYKKARCPEEFPWHQDNGYNFVMPQDYLTCWVPLVDATLDNGCPWVLPGVHKTGTLEHWQTDLGWQCAHGMTEAVPVEAKVGDVVVFSSLTPHRTGPNTTDSERKAYILQYCHNDSLMLADDQNGIPQNNPDRQFLVTSNGLPV